MIPSRVGLIYTLISLLNISQSMLRWCHFPCHFDMQALYRKDTRGLMRPACSTDIEFQQENDKNNNVQFGFEYSQRVINLLGNIVF